jgi:hypothetical protein
MGLIPPMAIDTERAKYAACLYNNVHSILTDYGWTEDLEPDPFWPKGKPMGTWRHPRYPGCHSMDAALITCAQKQWRYSSGPS